MKTANVFLGLESKCAGLTRSSVSLDDSIWTFQRYSSEHTGKSPENNAQRREISTKDTGKPSHVRWDHVKSPKKGTGRDPVLIWGQPLKQNLK